MSLIQQNQFGGSPVEGPYLHLSVFLEYYDTIKLNGVPQNAIRLRLFPFSLRDKARALLHSLPEGFIKTWDQLLQVFLSKYFPPSKTTQLQNQITGFYQKDGESLYEAWDRFKELMRLCPHHGLEKWLVVQTFYSGLNYNSRISVDAASGGALMNKKVDDAYSLIEDMSLNHCQWASERNTTPKPTGRHEVETLNLIAAKVDALTQKFDKLNENAPKPSLEQMNYLNNFSQRPINDPFSNTYNPGWRNHPNLFYKSNQPHFEQNLSSNVPRQPPGFQQRISNPQPVQKSNLEALLESCCNTSQAE
ncbi:uncharacterized protein LOC120277685 [Dioscorea cayenensis subsp. rotundata]|uniref:Uncharacterized protein LOC120277685 n=1 Tax=Dioscorea cayennensis subsp. rotundata TaxID=55577 RepID=A0AB40CPI1_DIOCR|nr:uncharacterized protein LOC120277685 [Dioscorea cayenensis subsp. rotundata]